MNSEFYCSVEEAFEELQKRQQEGVQLKVQEWWIKSGNTFPALPEVQNPAVLARQIATCRFEDILFQQMAVAGGFTPTWWPYTADTFTSLSPYKRSLIRPVRVRKTENGWHPQTRKLVKPHLWEKKPLRDIVTYEGELLTEWHRKLREQVIGPSITADLGGFSYPLFLSLFVAHGVLFEDYHGGESGEGLDGFTQKRFEPAWRYVRDEIGLSPIIVRLPWWPELQFYPTSVDWQQTGIIDTSRMVPI